MIWIWTAVTILALVLEFITVDLISVWFCFSGIVAIILSACGVGVTWQVVAFVVIAFALLLSLRKVCMKFLKTGKETTNVDALVGEKVKLLTPITDEKTGTAKINGVTWNCQEINALEVSQGEHVIIEQVKGNRLIVSKITNNKGEN